MEGNVILQSAPKPNVAGAAITGGSSVVTSILNGISASHAAKKNYQYSKQLMLEQNRLNRENYEIQRRDRISDILNSASWERQARKNAGLSTADSDGASAAQTAAGSGASSEPKIDAASPGTSNMQPVDYSSILGTAAQVARSFIENENTQADTQKKRSETEGVDIDNQTKLQENLARVDLLLKQGKLTENEAEHEKLRLQYDYDVMEFRKKKEQNESIISDAEVKIKDEQVKQEGLRTSILDLTKQLTNEQLRQAEFVTKNQSREFEMQMRRLQAEVEELYSRKILNKANASLAFRQEGLVAAQTFYQGCLNAFEKAKLPYANDMALNLKKQLEGSVELQAAEIDKATAQAAGMKFQNDHAAEKFYFDMFTNGLQAVTSSAANIAYCINPVKGLFGGAPAAPSASANGVIQLQTIPNYGQVALPAPSPVRYLP